jgi:hypothetical protein
MVIWWPWHRDPTMYLADDDPSTKAHEEGHVPQWLEGRFRFLRRYITKQGRLHLEAPCTARRIYFRVHIIGGFEADGLINYYGALYPTSYRLKGIDIEECRAVIRKCYEELTDAT